MYIFRFVKLKLCPNTIRWNKKSYLRYTKSSTSSNKDNRPVEVQCYTYIIPFVNFIRTQSRNITFLRIWDLSLNRLIHFIAYKKKIPWRQQIQIIQMYIILYDFFLNIGFVNIVRKTYYSSTHYKFIVE